VQGHCLGKGTKKGDVRGLLEDDQTLARNESKKAGEGMSCPERGNRKKGGRLQFHFLSLQKTRDRKATQKEGIKKAREKEIELS